MSRDIPQHTNRFDEGYLPTARTEDLVSTYSDDEVLLYDERSHHIHRLDAEVTAVWHNCDGRSSLQKISSNTGISRERVRVALSELSQGNLLVESAPDQLRVSRIDRRRITKLGLATLPGIISISAPIATAAASGTSSGCMAQGTFGCTSHEQCCQPANSKSEAFCNGIPSDGFCDIQAKSSGLSGILFS